MCPRADNPSIVRNAHDLFPDRSHLKDAVRIFLRHESLYVAVDKNVNLLAFIVQSLAHEPCSLLDGPDHFVYGTRFLVEVELGLRKHQTGLKTVDTRNLLQRSALAHEPCSLLDGPD